MSRDKLASLGFALALGAGALPMPATADDTIHWINHLDFLPGDSSVLTAFNAVDSGVGGGLSGLTISSTTAGEDAIGGGNKVVEKGLDVPPGFLVNGVRVCYELTSPGSYISQIRIAQLQDPPASAVVLLDDPTDLTAKGPACVDTAVAPLGVIEPANGALRLSLRINVAAGGEASPTDPTVGDKIVLRGIGLYLERDPSSAVWQHTHTYLTGKGKGHNNTVAVTGDAQLDATAAAPAPAPVQKPKKGRGPR